MMATVINWHGKPYELNDYQIKNKIARKNRNIENIRRYAENAPQFEQSQLKAQIKSIRKEIAQLKKELDVQKNSQRFMFT